MDKKGFTLIELLAVVTLIALISIIAIPKITNNIIKKKNEISEVNQKLLAAAADTYLENNKSIYNNNYEANGSTYCIPVQILIDNGVLEKPFKNVNGQEIDYSSQVKATYQAEYNSFSYELVGQNECEELIQYVSRPELSENMIPVIYNEESNSWVKADPKSHWYNYSEKKWANAVLVKELKETDASKSRYEYQQARAGTPILEQDILAQFVWIPRFRYQLFESNTQTPINIVFEDISKEKSLGTQPGQWLTHPAFTYNNQELSGIWVGKYEASIDNNNLLIKNNTPITNIDYVEANKKAIEMTNENNIYGLKKVNTHMTRNSEWGAAAYLTNSIYGNQENNSSTGNNTGIYNLSGNKEFVIVDNENENSKGYALNETNNWTTDNSYISNDNLYLTRGNNSIFNYNNSKVIDENTTFRITLSNTEIQNQNYQKKYIVTLDPNGGTLSETTKEVSYHEPYGSLPTPTREGYTFMGWNGKNMFDMETWLNQCKSVYGGTFIKDNKSITLTATTSAAYTITYYVARVGYGDINSLKTPVNPNSNYTLSWEKSFDEQGRVFMFVNDKDSKDGPLYQFSTNNLATKKTIQTTADAEYIRVRIDVDAGNSVTFSNLQLEEGDTATEYEPYYITPTTSVVQQKNHTLKAIWQANS